MSGEVEVNDNVLDITGIDHAELLAVLYNEAFPLGLGFLHASHQPMSLDEAREHIDEAERNNYRFDYVKGRPLKVRFSGDRLIGALLYDRDQGEGHCKRIVDRLRAKVSSKR